MKIISSEAHAALDYLTVLIFALAPTVIGLAGTSAMVSYVLAVVHLILTLVTHMPFSLVKIVPIRLHALVELVVGPVLVIGGLLLELPTSARVFFVAMGVITFAVWLLSSYSGSTGRSAAKLALGGCEKWLRPDARSQVTLRYEDEKPVGIEAVVLSTRPAQQ